MGVKFSVNVNPTDVKFEPKWYRARMPIFWWVHKWVHFRFILRELTSLAVAFYAITLLFYLRSLAEGPQMYEDFLAWMKTPLAVGLNIIAFVFVFFHSITWFNLAPKAISIRFGKMRIAGISIALMNYGAWIVITVVIFWFFIIGL